MNLEIFERPNPAVGVNGDWRAAWDLIKTIETEAFETFQINAFSRLDHYDRMLPLTSEIDRRIGAMRPVVYADWGCGSGSAVEDANEMIRNPYALFQAYGLNAHDFEGAVKSEKTLPFHVTYLEEAAQFIKVNGILRPDIITFVNSLGYSIKFTGTTHLILREAVRALNPGGTIFIYELSGIDDEGVDEYGNAGFYAGSYDYYIALLRKMRGLKRIRRGELKRERGEIANYLRIDKR